MCRGYTQPASGSHFSQTRLCGRSYQNPTYEQVCTGQTGHAEVVKVDYDPRLISLSNLLRIFFTTHDPTQLDRQGNDIGTQYRSVIFGDEDQQKTARTIKEEIEKEHIWPTPIVTAIEGPAHFWEAELKHHDYFKHNPHTAYCAAVIAPKVAKARKLYQHYFLSDNKDKK